MEEATLKMVASAGSPWMLNATVEEVALTPDTVPLSKSDPTDKAAAEVHLATFPVTPEKLDAKAYVDDP